MSKKLEIEMIPSSSWGVNARSLLSKGQWDIVRRKVYAAAHHKCEICGADGRMEAHEKWVYDEKNKIQKLEGLVSLCHSCHEVKHFGRSSLKGKKEKCIQHLMKVNKWKRHEAIRHISNKQSQWQRRNKYEWDVDMFILDGYFK